MRGAASRSAVFEEPARRLPDIARRFISRGSNARARNCEALRADTLNRGFRPEARLVSNAGTSGQSRPAMKGLRIVKRLMSMMFACAAAAACGGSSMDQGGGGGGGGTGVSLQLVSNARLGRILADGNGRALYYFSNDLPAGGGKAAVSNCTGSASDSNSCVHYWPIFHAANGNFGAGLNAGDVGQIMRGDGLPQTTYKGFPLYYFLGDTNAGDVNGESIPDWFVLRDPFYNVMTLDGGAARLTDAMGRTLYAFDQDTAGAPPVSNCAGTAGDRTTCVGNWPIFFAGDNLIVPTGVDATQFSTFVRADNQKQTAFRGHPLYYFVDDAAAGDLKGLTFPPGLPHWSTLNPANQ